MKIIRDCEHRTGGGNSLQRMILFLFPASADLQIEKRSFSDEGRSIRISAEVYLTGGIGTYFICENIGNFILPWNGCPSIICWIDPPGMIPAFS
jgi:hypothetical protein